jgi:hypothetical protein
VHNAEDDKTDLHRALRKSMGKNFLRFLDMMRGEEQKYWARGDRRKDW